jgi:hypothetical protein
MITVKLDDKLFMSEMRNIVEYSIGFLDGVKKGKNIFLNKLGNEVVALLKEYIDSSARVNPASLHHVYEWYETGSPQARLFDIQYTVSNLGLSFKSTFSQSRSIQNGSREPFYNKANIMETGMSVTIAPKNAQALRFKVGEDEVFTKNPVTVNNPGGNTEGQFEKTFDSFFSRYFTQAFLRSSGILSELGTPTAYKNNIRSGSKMGRNKGLETGYRWIANVKVGA